MIKYRPEIDGLRAVAVVLVVLFHARIGGLEGGFIGVDVFFVVSGFLITSLIVSDLSRGRFSFLDFWARRARRILPALIVVVVVSMVAGWFILLPEDYATLGQSAAAQAVFASNFLFWDLSGYFGPDAEALPLLHTWSLAVEEQFYLLFPTLMFGIGIAAWRLRIPVILVITVISFLIGVSIVEASPDAAFYLLPSRAWELGVGALLAMWVIDRPGQVSQLPKPVREATSVAGMAMILFAAFSFDSTTSFPGYAALLPVGGTALVIWSNSGTTTMTGRVLSLKPFVLVGLISYSLYLWHWPLLVFALYPTGSVELPPLALTAVLSASFVLAALSWRFVEQPFRQRKVLAKRPFLFGGAAASMIVIAVVGLALNQQDGVSSRLPDAVAYYQVTGGERSNRERSCVRDAFELPPITGPESFCVYGDADEPSFVLWGDSHADVLIITMDSLAEQTGLSGLHAGYTSCPPFLGIKRANRDSCGEFNDSVVRVMKENGIDTVALAARWGSYFNAPGTLIPIDERIPEYANWETEDLAVPALEHTADTLLNEGFDIWLVRDVPAFSFNPVRRLMGAFALNRGETSVGIEYSTYLELASEFDAVAERLQERGVKLIDLAARMCDDSFCPTARDGRLMYRDSSHLSVDGAHYVEPAFQPMFDSLLARQ